MPVAAQALQRVWISVHILVVGDGLFGVWFLEEMRNRWEFLWKGDKEESECFRSG